MTLSSLLFVGAVFANIFFADASISHVDLGGAHSRFHDKVIVVAAVNSGATDRYENRGAFDVHAKMKQQPSSAQGAKVQEEAQSDSLHSMNAAYSANNAQESAQVAKDVALHAEAMALNASDALQFVRRALQVAQASGGGLEEVAMRLESEVGKVGQSVAGAADAKRLEEDLEILRRRLKAAEEDGRGGAEAHELGNEIKHLEDELEKKYGYGEGSGDATRKRLEELERQIAEAEANGGVSNGGKSVDELKAEVETIREGMANKPHASQDRLARWAQGEDPQGERTRVGPKQTGSRHIAGGGGVDVDSSMPFGGVEPFGREDAAEDLTRASITESNGMVDQLEAAQGAEGKRAAFRALTHLRGGMIGAYDGIAKAHLGNVDRYNVEHSWRKEHPYKHLAEEEADVENWAFKGSKAPAPASSKPPAPSSAGLPAGPSPAVQ